MANRTIYSAEMTEKICELIATGKSLHEIGKMPGMPTRDCMFRWLRDPRREAFKLAYIEAGRTRGEALVEEAVAIATETLERSRKQRVVEVGEGKNKRRKIMMGIDKAELGAARLKIDTLMRRAVQLDQRKYGQLMRHAGEEGGPISVEIVRFGDKESTGNA